MRQFVKYQTRQFGLRILDEGVEQRVTASPVQVAQGGVRRHRIDADLQTLRALMLGHFAGFGLVEVTTVANTAGYRKTPGLERERQLGRGHDVPHDRAALQVGVTVVAGVVRQRQVGHGKLANALRQRQAVFQWRRRLRIGQPLLHRFGRLQHLQAETELPYERLLKLYKEVAGKSPSKGQLPFSADWFMTWQPNIHSSLFYNIHSYLQKTTALEDGDAEHVMLVMLAGLLAFFLLEKLVLWRHSHGHEELDDAGDESEHDHAMHAHGHGHDQGRSGLMILIGNSVHNFCDGIVIAASFLADPALGLAATLAIVAHAVPREAIRD